MYTTKNQMRSIETTTKAPICTKDDIETLEMVTKCISLHKKIHKTSKWRIYQGWIINESVITVLNYLLSLSLQDHRIEVHTQRAVTSAQALSFYM